MSTAAVVEFVLAGGVRGSCPAGRRASTTPCRPRSGCGSSSHARRDGRPRAARRGVQRRCDPRGDRLRGAARDLGYDAIMLAAPPTSLPTPARARGPLQAVADAVGLPMSSTTIPARAGVEIGFDCLDAIADHPRSSAIKESSGDFSRFLALRRRYGDRIDDHVRLRRPGGRLLLLGRALLAGGHGERAAAPARRDHGRRQQRRPAGARTASSTASCRGCSTWRAGSYNQKAKLGLAHQGFDCGDVRQPLLPLRPPTRRS